MRWRHYLAPAVLAAALAPTATSLWQEVSAQEDETSQRERVLAAIPRDPAVLINVKARDMPASPDILHLGKRATKALERCLADNVDVQLRTQCAVTLHALGDRRALPSLQAALADWEPQVRFEVVRALGAIPDPTSVDPLIAIFKREDEESYIRRAVLASFSSISDQRVVRLLMAEVKNKPKADENKEDFRAAAFDALWDNRHLMGRATLVAETRRALESDDDALVLSATYASTELREPGLVNALGALMGHQSVEIRNKAVYALGRVGDKKAAKALLDRMPDVRESRMLNNIAFALERLDRKAFFENIKPVVEHKQAVIRLNAAFVLGDVRHAEGLPMLETALGDASDFVRVSAVVAVGKLGNAEAAQRDAAMKALEPFVDHQNLSVREEAVHAVHALSEKGRPDLLHDKLFTLDRNKHGDVVQRAAIALAEAGDKRALDHVLPCFIHDSCGGPKLERYLVANHSDAVDSRMLVSWTRGFDHLTPILGQLHPTGSTTVARGVLEENWASPFASETRESLQLIGSLNDATLLPVVQKRAGSEHTWARVHALVASLRLGDQGAAARLDSEMDNLPAEWFPAFVNAVAHVSQPKARAELGPALEKREADADPNIALAAAAIRLAWEPNHGVYRMLDALGAGSAYERRLASHYLAKNRSRGLTFVLRRAFAREGRPLVRDHLRVLLDKRK